MATFVRATLILLSLLLTICVPAHVGYGDIAPDPLSGGVSITVSGDSKTSVTLLHNTVKIRLSARRCYTRAFFRLKNLGETDELEIGFPMIKKDDAADFVAFVDDKLQVIENKEETYSDRLGRPREHYWKAWKMTFAAGQTRLIEVRYNNPPSSGYSPILQGRYPSYDKWLATGVDYKLSDNGYDKEIELHEWLNILQMRYLLVTGSYWKGPIERCRVEVDLSDLPLDAVLEVRPAAHLINSQRIVWEWQNIEPAANIYMTFLGASPRKSIIPYLEVITKDHPEDKALTATLEKLKRDFPDDATILQRQSEFVEKERPK